MSMTTMRRNNLSDPVWRRVQKSLNSPLENRMPLLLNLPVQLHNIPGDRPFCQLALDNAPQILNGIEIQALGWPIRKFHF